MISFPYRTFFASDEVLTSDRLKIHSFYPSDTASCGGVANDASLQPFVGQRHDSIIVPREAACHACLEIEDANAGSCCGCFGNRSLRAIPAVARALWLTLLYLPIFGTILACKRNTAMMDFFLL